MSDDTRDADLLNAAVQRWFQELSDRGMFTTDADLVVRTWNRWLEAQTGIAANRAVGQTLFDLFPSLVDRGLDRYYRDALAGEVKVLSERFHKYLIPISRNFHTVGITDMAQSARITPLLVDGDVVGTLTVIEDVTERVVSERELRSQIAASEHARAVAEEASRLKDEFLATLSHEIRTPLNAVLGWARILRTQPNVKSRAHALEVIERNAASQLRLVEDLLDMARVISGKLRLDVKTVNLADVAQAAIDVVRPAAEAKQIAIATEVDANLPAVSGDAERLQQVIWNLMSNAVKFTERHGQITVRVRHIGDSVAVSVRDTGQGISRDFLPYVFDRFRQADASATRRHGGLGLGLAIVRQIVELHGGTVSVDSAGTNKGTTFEIRLPATTVPAGNRKGPAKGRDRREAVTLKGVSILIVDDNDDGREMLMAALSDYGARIVAVDSAAAALEVLSNDHFVPNVVIADVGMPEIDGYGLIRQIRGSVVPRVSQVPAIAVTAYANPEDRIRALVAGFQSHVAKPVDAPLLAAAIRTLASRRRAASVRK